MEFELSFRKRTGLAITGLVHPCHAFWRRQQGSGGRRHFPIPLDMSLANVTQVFHVFSFSLFSQLSNFIHLGIISLIFLHS